MEYLTGDDFTQNQILILEHRMDGDTYEQIQQFMTRHTGINTTPKQISTCLLRSSLGLKWDYGMVNGEHPYLCPADMRELADIVRSFAELGAALDTVEVLDESARLKGLRIAHALEFLSQIGCPELEKKLYDKETTAPTRTWINGVLEDLSVHIKNRRFIDPKRLEACSYEVIDSFYQAFGSLLQNVHPLLLFNADETSFDTKSKRKAVVPENVRLTIEAGLPEMPHISAMCCCNVYGAGPPPLILLEALKNLPPELANLVYANKVAVGSTSNGFMTRDMFLLWSIHFVNWLMLFRQNLPDNIKTSRALLILDGHTSRENPLACMLFRKALIDVVVLPSHTTHVLQWFDVGLASALKMHYSAKFKKNLKEAADDDSITSYAAKYRYAAVKTFIDAWSTTCTTSNCIAAAKATGIYPFNPMATRESVFVRNLTAEEQARFEQRARRNANRITISSKLLTDPDLIVQLANQLGNNPRFKHLSMVQEAMTKTYSQIVRDTLAEPRNESLLLSKLMPLYMPGAAPVTF